MDKFIRRCSRRERDARVEGAYPTFAHLQTVACGAAEHDNMEELEGDLHLKQFCMFWTRCTVTMRTWCFPRVANSCSRSSSRLPNETVQKYVVRHATAVKKMREGRIEMPDQLAAWHMLSRTGVPPVDLAASQDFLRRSAEHRTSDEGTAEGLQTRSHEDCSANSRGRRTQHQLTTQPTPAGSTSSGSAMSGLINR